MSRAPLVLIVSEHEWASRSLESILSPRGYAVLRAYNGRQAFERVGGSNVDAVFIDRNLPDTSGEAVCRLLLERECVSRSAPIILMTSGTSSREERLDAMRAGAWDLLSQPIDAEELLLRMDRLIRAKVDADRVAEEALIDGATGLYSWHGVTRRLRELAAAAERFGRPLACVVFSPDDLAAAGPSLTLAGEAPAAGHAPAETRAGGDADAHVGRDAAAGSGSADLAGEDERAFLTKVAGILRDATRRSDVIGRIGPREFAIVAPDTPPEGAEILAARLRAGHTNGSGIPTARGRAGVCAIQDLSAAGMDPLELIVQATLASRTTPPDRMN